MLVLLSTNDRTAVPALLLAVGKTTMRLAVPGRSDTVELTLVNGEWESDDGSLITVDSMIQNGEFDLAAVGYEVFPRTRTALN